MTTLKTALFSLIGLAMTAAAALAADPNEQTLREFGLEGHVVIGFEGSVTLWDDHLTSIKDSEDLAAIRSALGRKELTSLSEVYTNSSETVVICIVKSGQATVPFHLLVMDRQGAHPYRIDDVQEGRIRSKNKNGLYPDLILTVN